MKKIAILFALLFTVQYTLQAQAGFKPLLKGKNLKAWQTPGLQESWTIKDGMLVVQSDKDKTGDILWTKKEYKDFVIKAQFKFGDGTVDSGFFLRNDSQQIQIGESGSLKRDMTCSPYIPGKSYPVEAEGVADIIKMDGWNDIQVKAEGNTYTAWLNGVEVMTYTSDNAIETGPIGIQLHPGRDMSIYYKDISVKSL
jgi:hypothetical protein